ncbi:BrnA antitoxin family protein [Limnohabitans sp. Rim8]|uniref:BrnA antitoxin family protein n=1 Tax=Limnohabitans sp. Rim8 TaxID=1100718 RepID=UPI00345BBA8C
MRLVESSASAVPIAKKERPTLSGSKMNAMSLEELITALKVKEREAPYVWDGQDEDERTATPEELAHRLALARKRGRPAGSGVKEQVAIRLDKEILEAFRAEGKGWQTRINQALRRYLAEHPTQS